MVLIWFAMGNRYRLVSKTKDPGEIGDALRALRNARGFSMRDVFWASGVSRSYIGRLEQNLDRNPSIACLQCLARGFRMHLVDLLLTLGYIDNRGGIENNEEVHPGVVSLLGDMPWGEQIKLARAIRTMREVFAE